MIFVSVYVSGQVEIAIMSTKEKLSTLRQGLRNLNGATREEVADVLAISIQMGGGSSMLYAAKAMDAYDDLKAQMG